MDQTATRRHPSTGKAPSAWATGLVLFAAVMMTMSGTFQAFAGLVAVVQEDFYVETGNYVLQLDATTWGWIHLVVGVLVVTAGFALLVGNMYGRIVGVALAMVSALTTFAFIPYEPFWSLTIIALDIFVIWAITAHGGRRYA